MRKKITPYKHAKTQKERVERRRRASREWARRQAVARPGYQAEVMRRYRASRPGHDLEKARKRRQDHPRVYARQLARQRKVLWPARYAANKDKILAATRARTLSLRKAAIAALGGKCVRCGYDANLYALNIDHINGDGAKERRTPGHNQSKHYKAIAELGGQGRYQCLCANCNAIKRMENGEHPGRPSPRVEALAPTQRR